jgi:SecD/SecF fusion protein
LTLAGLSLLGATLTLPGIAGILLALGMAVDANILVNERVREETKRGRGVVSAVEHGFRRAYAAITDANATTLIKMLILFVVGTGAIKGFAVTISLGILVSMFTAIVLVRLLTAQWLKSARPKSLSVGTWLHRKLFPERTAIPFMRARYSGLVLSALISLASLALAVHPGLKWGVDFAGGVVVEARTQEAADFGLLRSKLGGLGLGPVQVQQFGGPQDVLLRFEQQPAGRQQAAVETVKEELQQVAPGAEVRRVEVVGATVGGELFHEGLLALALAGLAMFAYIAFRFEWPFAVGAVVTMFLDLTKRVGFFALTGIEFDLTSIAAILAIMGFSINDKVVVYDRVRENLRLYKSKPLREVIDLSINETLSRTVGTSAALFLAIAPLALFGGPALGHFALALLFGLVLATSSSILIAAPILLNLGERRLRKSNAVESLEGVPAAG